MLFNIMQLRQLPCLQISSFLFLKREQRQHTPGVSHVPVPVGSVPGVPGGVWGEDGSHRLGTALPHPGEGPVSSHESVIPDGLCIISI